MSYFDQYSGYATDAANQYGIPPNILFGLVSQESSWNPNASPGTTSAWGFTQLTNAAANQVGVANLYGGAQYLASMPGNDWTTKLAHYFQGPGATINASGLNYANQVLTKAKGFLGGIGANVKSLGSDLVNGGRCASGDITACAGLAGNVLGIGGGTSWVQQIQDWFKNSGLFERLALAAVAIVLIIGAVYFLKGKME
jgi:hypothetical protein